MAKVLVCDKLSEKGMGLLKAATGLQVDLKPGLPPAELKKTVKGYDGLIVRSASQITADIIEAADSLKVIGRAGIGVDNIDLDAATKKGIVVMNTPSGNAVTTAEHAIAMMFAVSRKIPQATASLRSGKWERENSSGANSATRFWGLSGSGISDGLWQIVP